MEASPSPMALAIGELLDRVHHSLLTQDPDRIEPACKALLEGLTAQIAGHSKASVQQAIRAQEVEALNARFQQLRQALAQSASASARQLATLLPDRLPGPYGNKSAFGQPGLSGARRSYQA